MMCGENVSGSSQSRRIATTRHNRDGRCRFVTVCQFARVLENIESVDMRWGENVSGSSRSGRIGTTRHNRDEWRRFVTISPVATDNIQGGGGGDGGWDLSESYNYFCAIVI